MGLCGLIVNRDKLQDMDFMTFMDYIIYMDYMDI